MINIRVYNRRIPFKWPTESLKGDNPVKKPRFKERGNKEKLVRRNIFKIKYIIGTYKGGL